MGVWKHNFEEERWIKQQIHIVSLKITIVSSNLVWGYFPTTFQNYIQRWLNRPLNHNCPSLLTHQTTGVLSVAEKPIHPKTKKKLRLYPIIKIIHLSRNSQSWTVTLRSNRTLLGAICQRKGIICTHKEKLSEPIAQTAIECWYAERRSSLIQN